MRYLAIGAALIAWFMASVLLACTLIGIVVVIEDSWLKIGVGLVEKLNGPE
jgi:hypothetical protein